MASILDEGKKGDAVRFSITIRKKSYSGSRGKIEKRAVPSLCRLRKIQKSSPIWIVKIGALSIGREKKKAAPLRKSDARLQRELARRLLSPDLLSKWPAKPTQIQFILPSNLASAPHKSSTYQPRKTAASTLVP